MFVETKKWADEKIRHVKIRQNIVCNNYDKYLQVIERLSRNNIAYPSKYKRTFGWTQWKLHQTGAIKQMSGSYAFKPSITNAMNTV